MSGATRMRGMPQRPTSSRTLTIVQKSKPDGDRLRSNSAVGHRGSVPLARPFGGTRRHSIEQADIRRIIPGQRDITDFSKSFDLSPYLDEKQNEHIAFFGAAIDFFESMESKAIAPPDFFASLVAIARGAEGFIRAGENVPADLLDSYVRSRTAMQRSWSSAADEYLNVQMENLLERITEEPPVTEQDWHRLAQMIHCLAPSLPIGIDVFEWRLLVAKLLPTRSDWHWMVVEAYERWEAQAYANNETSRLWHIVCEALRRLNGLNTEYTQNPRIVELQEKLSAVGCLGPLLYPEDVEELVGRYCLYVQNKEQKTFSRGDPAPPCTEADIDALESRMAEKQGGTRTLKLLHKVIQNLNWHTNGAAIVRRLKAEDETREWPLETFPKFNARVVENGIKGAMVEGFITAADTIENRIEFQEPTGFCEKSGFDYVYYPFGETRAHEYAQNEQITREMSTPGIYSDGPREEFVRNIPPQHAKLPKDVSYLPRFKAFGPAYIAYSLCRAVMGNKRKRLARPRPRLTLRPDPRRPRPVKSQSSGSRRMAQGTTSSRTRSAVEKKAKSSRNKTFSAAKTLENFHKHIDTEDPKCPHPVLTLRGGGDLGNDDSRRASQTSSKSPPGNSSKSFSGVQFQESGRQQRVNPRDSDESSDSGKAPVGGQDSEDESLEAMNRRIRGEGTDQQSAFARGSGPVRDDTLDRSDVLTGGYANDTDNGSDRGGGHGHHGESDDGDFDGYGRDRDEEGHNDNETVAVVHAHELTIYDGELDNDLPLVRDLAVLPLTNDRWYTLRQNGERLDVCLDPDRRLSLRDFTGLIYQVLWFPSQHRARLVLPGQTLPPNERYYPVELRPQPAQPVATGDRYDESYISSTVPEGWASGSPKRPFLGGDEDGIEGQPPAKTSKVSGQFQRSPTGTPKQPSASSHASPKVSGTPKHSPPRGYTNSPGTPESVGDSPSKAVPPSRQKPRTPTSSTNNTSSQPSTAGLFNTPPDYRRTMRSPNPSPEGGVLFYEDTTGSAPPPHTQRTPTGNTPPSGQRAPSGLTPPPGGQISIREDTDASTQHPSSPERDLYDKRPFQNSVGPGIRTEPEQSPGPPSTFGTPESEDPIDYCHPCPRYAGQYHHICHTSQLPQIICPGQQIYAPSTRGLGIQSPSPYNDSNGENRSPRGPGQGNSPTRPGQELQCPGVRTPTGGRDKSPSASTNSIPDDSLSYDEIGGADGRMNPLQRQRRAAIVRLYSHLRDFRRILLHIRLDPTYADGYDEELYDRLVPILAETYTLMWDVGGPTRLLVNMPGMPSFDDFLLNPQPRLAHLIHEAMTALRIIIDVVNEQGLEGTGYDPADVYRAQLLLAYAVTEIRNDLFRGGARVLYRQQARNGAVRRPSMEGWQEWSEADSDTSDSTDSGSSTDRSDPDYSKPEGGKSGPLPKEGGSETEPSGSEPTPTPNPKPSPKPKDTISPTDTPGSAPAQPGPYDLPANWTGTTAATYRQWMFAEEMRDELADRNVAFRAAGATIATLADLLEAADNAGNYGRGYRRSYRFQAGLPDAKTRPRGGYEYPDE